ncbi:putative transcriptional regulator [Candidatus Zixiibacteriota bacterium]|nr:putative transcriptional regulator [candidate division Zixibacteria bacterium]
MKQSPKMPAEQRRAQLITAAIEVFNRKGYDGATTEDIAREAGVTKGALYFHFRNKEEIFLAVVKETAGRHIAEVLDAIEIQPDIDHFIESVVTYSFTILKDEKHLTMELWEQAQKIPGVRSYISEIHSQLVEGVARHIHKIAGIGLKKARSLVWVMHAIWDGVLVQKFCYSEKENFREMRMQVISMFQLYIKNAK